jgi:hypothetical protein
MQVYPISNLYIGVYTRIYEFQNKLKNYAELWDSNP